jgi:superfamily II DNA or RNA helicase
LVIAHRLELITQAKEKLEDISGIPCGVIKAGFPVEESMSVQVASIQSLVRRKRYPDAGLVIIDEAHHSRAISF